MKMMNLSIKIGIAVAFLTLYAFPARGRQTNGQRRTAAPQNDLESDPSYKRLSPEDKTWVKSMMDRIHAAIERGDTKALEQLQLDLAKHQVTGMELCGHIVGETTFVDARVSNAGGDEAFAIRWIAAPPGSPVHTAIFTGRKRCVVADGDTIDGKYIVRATANSLALSRTHSLTAWEGEYWNDPVEERSGVRPHRGAFIENKFAFEIDPTKGSPNDSLGGKEERDFRWDDDKETIVAKAGLIKPSATKNTPQAPSSQPQKKRTLPTIPCLPFQNCGQQGKP